MSSLRIEIGINYLAAQASRITLPFAGLLSWVFSSGFFEDLGLWYSRDKSGNDNHVQIINSNVLEFNGVDQLIRFNDLSGVSIISSEGTATPSVNGNDIEVTAGTLSNLVLSDGTVCPASNGETAQLIDTVGGNHGTIINFLANMWTTWDGRPNHIIDGFTTGVENLLRWSEDFSNAVWSTENVTVTGKDTIIAAVNGRARVFSLSIPVVQGQPHTLTVAVASVVASQDFSMRLETAGTLDDTYNFAPVAGNTYSMTSTPDQNTINVFLYLGPNSDAGVAVQNDEITCSLQLEQASIAGNYYPTEASPLTTTTKIPASSVNPGVDALGGHALTNPASYWHNNAESDFIFPTDAALLAADVIDYMFTGGVPNELGYDDIVANVDSNDSIFADVSVTDKKKNLAVYDVPQTGGALASIESFLNQ